MRFHILTTVAMALAFLLAGPVQAGTEVTTANLDLLWDDSDNPSATGIGTPAIGAAPGDEILLGIYISLDPGSSASFIGMSVEFDNDGGDELDLLSVTELDLTADFNCTPLPTCFTNFGPELSNVSAGVISTMESTLGGGGGFAYTFEMGTLGNGPVGPVTIKMGEMLFAVTQNVATDGIDVVSGELNVGFDGVFDNAGAPLNVAYLDAEVNTLPAPSTGLMALFSLGALGLVARKR